MKAAYVFLKEPFFGRFRVAWRNPLPDEEIKEWEKRILNSGSGGQICAWFGQAKTSVARATIVMGHPMGKEAKGYFIKNGYTELLRRNGYHVVVFDFNGFGESSQGNFNYHEDLLTVAAEAARKAPKIPVGYHGISLGGLAGIIALCSENPFQFVIIESAATTLDEFWIRFRTPRVSLQILNILLPRLRRKVRAIDRIREVKGASSLLFIYSLSDQLTPVEMGKRLLERSPLPSEIWTVPQADHAAIVRSRYRDSYFKKILSFYNNPL